MKLVRGHVHSCWGKSPLLMTAVTTRRTIRNRWGGGGRVSPAPYMNKKICYLLQSKTPTIYVNLLWLRRCDMKILSFGLVFQQNLMSIVDLLLYNNYFLFQTYWCKPKKLHLIKFCCIISIISVEKYPIPPHRQEQQNKIISCMSIFMYHDSWSTMSKISLLHMTLNI